MGVIESIFGKSKIKLSSQTMPKHIAISGGGSQAFANSQNISLPESYKKKYENIKEIINVCTRLNIPLFTFYLLPLDFENNEQYPLLMDSFVDFFLELKKFDLLHKNQIKVTVLGKWYDLPGRVVDAIKLVLEETKDYDKFFLNLCINYDGQQEIVDACKLIAKQVQVQRLDPDRIDKSVFKENIYASYFMPPELIIKTGSNKRLSGFLLWDCPNAKIYFADKTWQEFSKEEFLKAIEWWQKG